jgi:hypothetical protein
MTNWIDPLLRETLDGRAAAALNTSCLDAETAAAFTEDTLAAAERTRAEAHAADCARCQALLAALASTMPQEVERAWWRRPAVAWLVPAAVVATALIVWINIPRRDIAAPSLRTTPELSQRAQSESSPTSPPAGTPPRAAAAPPAPSTQDSLQARSAASARVGAQERDSAALKNEAPTALGAELRAQDMVLPSAPVQTDTFAFHTMPGVTGEPTVTSESRREAPAEGAPEPSIAESVTLADRNMAATARRLDTSERMTIVSSNPISRWRIDAPGMVQHSTDGGVTWEAQPTGVNITFTAGSSPSRSVCWLVGGGGIVLLTTDEGRSWRRVPFPVAADLLSIRATDDKTATVATADGRTFSTSDRGLRWAR